MHLKGLLLVIKKRIYQTLRQKGELLIMKQVMQFAAGI